MNITTRQKRQIIPYCVPPIYIGNEKIDEVGTNKVIGVTIDNNLYWTNYVTEITKRISRWRAVLSCTPPVPALTCGGGNSFSRWRQGTRGGPWGSVRPLPLPLPRRGAGLGAGRGAGLGAGKRAGPRAGRRR